MRPLSLTTAEEVREVPCSRFGEMKMTNFKPNSRHGNDKVTSEA